MNAPLRHPVIPAVDSRPQETAPEASKPPIIYIDLDYMDAHKVARVWSPYRNGGK